MRRDPEMLGLILTVAAIFIMVSVLNIIYPAKPHSRIFMPTTLWNRANASTVLYNYTAGVLTPLWNPDNPSLQCTKYTGPKYRPDGEKNGYNPAPANLPWIAQPYCGSCHSNEFVGYYNYTAMAHPGGNPVGYGTK